MAPNLVNAERVSVTFGTHTVLHEVSLGLGRGEVVGVVGRNGGGKTTLLRVLTGQLVPDSGRVRQSGTTSVGSLSQSETFPPGASVRDVVLAGAADHVWAAEPAPRAVVTHLLADVDLDRGVGALSGGERRRVSLAALLLGEHDLLALDEPTNHLDVEAVAWLAAHLRLRQSGGMALLVVSHDRWFLDALCTRMLEVHDGVVDAYDGGYSAYVLARAERARIAAGAESRRQNLLRKELAWLRRGPPARTSKPQFRITAANALIAGEPPPRDNLALRGLSTARLGKDVFDLEHVDAAVGSGGQRRVLLRDLSWSIGPGERIGLVGVNGAGKTTLLRLLAGDRRPDAGTVRRGRTLRLAVLPQEVPEPDEAGLDGSLRVLESVERVRRVLTLPDGRELSASSLLTDFGFPGSRLATRVAELSGGERRRLSLLRLLMGEPNVLLLDEPTNDLDIDTLTVLEDYLDSWPGTLIVVSHDRYFHERVTDVTYGLLGDGRCVLLPRGVEQYLEMREQQLASPASPASPGPEPDGTRAAVVARQARKDLRRMEARLDRLHARTTQLHDEMLAAATDHVRLVALHAEAERVAAEQRDLEDAWLAAAELTD